MNSLIICVIILAIGTLTTIIFVQKQGMEKIIGAFILGLLILLCLFFVKYSLEMDCKMKSLVIHNKYKIVVVETRANGQVLESKTNLIWLK